MGAAYTILGKSVPPQILALGTIGAVVLLAAPKPWAATPKKEVKVEAATSDEEKYINDFLKEHS